MILINLLPHRELARKRHKALFQSAMLASFMFALLLAAVVHWVFQAQIHTQQDRNAFLRAEIADVNAQIQEIAGLEREINGLRARQNAVEELQTNRNLPVHFLNELVAQVPEGVYIRSLKQNGNLVEMVGVAQSNERVSQVLRNLSQASAWFSNPSLREIAASKVALSSKEEHQVVNFSLSFSLSGPAGLGSIQGSGGKS